MKNNIRETGEKFEKHKQISSSMKKSIVQDEFNQVKKEVDNYTEEELLKIYETLTGLKQEDMNIEKIRQYLKDYWKEQICKDENIKVQ